MNKFNLLCELDKKEEAEKIYKDLLSLAKKDNDVFTEEMLLRNHYFFFNDSISLYEGYGMSKSLVENDSVKVFPAAMRGIYEGLICSDYLNKNDVLNAGVYANLCEKHLGEVIDPDFSRFEYKGLADYYDKVGNVRKANEYLRRYVDLLKESEEAQDPLLKMNIAQFDTIRRHELAVETERHELRVRQYVIIGVSIFVILAMLTFILRWRNRQREKTLKLKLEAERHQRRVLAMSMHQEETEKLLDDVKQEMDRINKEGGVKSEETKRLEQNVKLHIAGKGEKETFEEAFANVSPEFSLRLKELAPSLTSSNIRLCTYLYMGLTPHEIADLMHITDNGLRVARFRLRQKFGLSKDDSLEDFLRRLGEK